MRDFDPVHRNDVAIEGRMNGVDAFYCVKELVTLGMLAKLGAVLFITERGKIALAILEGRRARL